MFASYFIWWLCFHVLLIKHDCFTVHVVQPSAYFQMSWDNISFLNFFSENNNKPWLFFFLSGVSYSSARTVHIFLCFVVFYKLIPAHNVFVLYISQYLTFALHFVGQGPVSMYNNFIYAIGFSQHFNGFNWIHISLDIYCIHSTLHFIDVSLCSVPPRPIALSSLLSRCWNLCASSSLSNSSE